MYPSFLFEKEHRNRANSSINKEHPILEGCGAKGSGTIKLFEKEKEERKIIMVLLEFTIASHDELNGEKALIQHNEIRKVLPLKMFKDKIPNVMEGEKPKVVSLLMFTTGSPQTVQEDMKTIRRLVTRAENKQVIKYD